MLMATALPAALWMRGETVLHAGAVLLPGMTHAVAFAGASGSGKSTMLRALLEHGARLVADDTVCVRAAANGYQVAGLSAGTQRRVGAWQPGIQTAAGTGWPSRPRSRQRRKIWEQS